MHKKSMVIISALLIALLGALFGVRYFFKPSHEEIPESAASKDPRLKELKKVEDEIKELSDKEVIKMAELVEAKLHKPGLIKRLNNNEATEQEKKESKELLVRLALLNVEKTKRKLGGAW